MNQLKRGSFIVKMVLLGALFFSVFCSANLAVNATQKEINGSSTENADLLRGKELFLKARKMYYNAEAQFSENTKVLNSAAESFNKLADGYLKYYWLAETAFEKAEIAECNGEKRQAAKDFTESGQLIRKSLEYKADYSDSNRILADSIMRLMDYNGAFYMMTQGPQALQLLNKAMSLDNKNYAAMNSLGTYYLNAPAIGGGSVAKGIQILLKALESKDEFDNFISFVWLGKAYQKKKDKTEAEHYLNKALEIYPNSPWVKSLMK